MTQIEEKELDDLIFEAIEREKLADLVCMHVEQELRKKRISASCKRWVGRVFFAFALPVVLFLVVLSCGFLYQHSNHQIYLLCLIFPVIVMFFSANTLIRELL